MNNKKKDPYNSEEIISLSLLNPRYLFTWVGLFFLFPITKLPISVTHKLGDMLGFIFFRRLEQYKTNLDRVSTTQPS